ncbi:uncharacterized protein BT62DRAFT_926140 [Guyanagaster necrorhizus]|uniref:Uncharacterized protein n=1 Tax=Guyanagaster necrorhizus TaxID=856835 RepID=A0A9P8AY74_9AGAR|nr:uncharacterized protein BT62DRAFT_926140 [Guyanagaster necrorhizus MCA 3950]KAG7451941.1 hypothetical protein BT62DRAFT_926140 [Guyanagaster necrorhizus MCA 3950]
MYSGYPASYIHLRGHGSARSGYPPIPRSYARYGEEDDQPFMPSSGGGIRVQEPDEPTLPLSSGQEISLLDQEAGSHTHDEMPTRARDPGYEHGGSSGPMRPFDVSGHSRGSGYGSPTSQRGSNSPPSGYPSSSAAYPPGYATAVTGLPSPFASLDPGQRYYD